LNFGAQSRTTYNSVVVVIIIIKKKITIIVVEAYVRARGAASLLVDVPMEKTHGRKTRFFGNKKTPSKTKSVRFVTFLKDSHPLFQSQQKNKTE